MRTLSLLSVIPVVTGCSNDVLGANGIPSRTLSIKVGETLSLRPHSAFWTCPSSPRGSPRVSPRSSDFALRPREAP